MACTLPVAIFIDIVLKSFFTSEPCEREGRGGGREGGGEGGGRGGRKRGRVESGEVEEENHSPG